MSKSALTGSEPFVRKARHHEDALAQLLAQIEVSSSMNDAPKFDIVNVDNWLEANTTSFIPPVCNKLMHHTQLDVMFVGGPNQRDDFHLEEGEELFWQLKGNMELVVEERGSQKSIPIREGEIFLLPGKIPHSPRRSANSIGLVVERQRVKGQEMDGLRYYCKDKKTILYQKIFPCKDLGKELGPIIKEFFASDECATGVPKQESVMDLPWKIDDQRTLQDPFSFSKFYSDLAAGKNAVFEGVNQMEVTVAVDCQITEKPVGINKWIYVIEGQIELSTGQVMTKSDSVLLSPGETLRGDVHGKALILSQKKLSE